MSSDSKPFTVGITGITGRLGRLLLSALLTSRPKVHIRGLARDLSKLPSSFTT